MHMPTCMDARIQACKHTYLMHTIHTHIRHLHTGMKLAIYNINKIMHISIRLSFCIYIPGQRKNDNPIHIVGKVAIFLWSHLLLAEKAFMKCTQSGILQNMLWYSVIKHILCGIPDVVKTQVLFIH